MASEACTPIPVSFACVTLHVMGFTGLIKAQVSIPTDNNVPADAVTNTMWFVTSDLTAPTQLQYETIQAALGSAYSTMTPHLSARMNLGAATVKCYHWQGPQPILPAFTGPITFNGAPATTDGAPEVALVLSYHASLNQSGIPNARRRGRIYLGPLAVTGAVTPLDNLRSAALAMGSTLYTTLNTGAGINGVKWAVYSAAQNGAPWVTGGWVDNAWDTQRRRGIKATTRSTFPA